MIAACNRLTSLLKRIVTRERGFSRSDAIDDRRIQSTGNQICALVPCTARQRSNLTAKTSLEHAQQLLIWLQADNGRTATIAAAELRAIHLEMCMELNWEVGSWNSIAREFRTLLGTRKEYASVNSRRICVYRIPVGSAADG